VIQVSGCDEVNISNGPVRQVRSPALWSDLAQALDLTSDELRPLPCGDPGLTKTSLCYPESVQSPVRYRGRLYRSKRTCQPPPEPIRDPGSSMQLERLSRRSPSPREAPPGMRRWSSPSPIAHHMRASREAIPEWCSVNPESARSRRPRAAFGMNAAPRRTSILVQLLTFTSASSDACDTGPPPPMYERLAVTLPGGGSFTTVLTGAKPPNSQIPWASAAQLRRHGDGTGRHDRSSRCTLATPCSNSPQPSARPTQ